MIRRSSRSEPPAPPLPPDIELVDVTRLTVMLDTGDQQTWDLESTDSWERNDTATLISVGKKVIWIATAHIICFEVEPVKKNKVKPSGSI